MRLSVLDQSGIAAGRSPYASIRESLALARACEEFGYHRFWVSEHHNNDGIAGSAPEVLLGALANVTRSMRIGSAGIMLPHYAPLKVAEQFRVLDALTPGRVDLGIGRGPGADRQTSYALKPAMVDHPLMVAGPDSFVGDLADVIAWSRGQPMSDDHPFAGVRAQPLGATAPQPWLLGSSALDRAARRAIRAALSLCILLSRRRRLRRSARCLSHDLPAEPILRATAGKLARMGLRRTDLGTGRAPLSSLCALEA